MIKMHVRRTPRRRGQEVQAFEFHGYGHGTEFAYLQDLIHADVFEHLQ